MNAQDYKSSTSLTPSHYQGTEHTMANKTVYMQQKITLYKTSSEAMIKVKLSMYLNKYHAMKTYWGSGGIAQRIL
jgi:hypothetical protein